MSHSGGDNVNQRAQQVPELNSSAESAELIRETLAQLRQATETFVPLFLARMPAAYHHDMDAQTRLSHIKAIIANEASGLPQEITLRNEAGTRYTFINDRSYPGQLSKLVERLPQDPPLCSARVYTATDNSLVLDVFDLGHPARFDGNDPQQAACAKALIEAAKADPDLPEETLHRHLDACSAEYVMTAPLAIVSREYHLIQAVRNSGNCIVRRIPRPQAHLSEILVGVCNADRRLLFERISRFMGRHRLDIQRAYLNSFEFGTDEHVSVLSFLVQDASASNPDLPTRWDSLQADLRRLGYLDSMVLNLAERLPDWSLLQTEILVSLSHLSHQRLVKQDPLAFSRDRILELAIRYQTHARTIVDLFLARFSRQDPPDSARTAERLRDQLQAEVDKSDEQQVLMSLLEAVGCTLRSNVMAPDRFALALRIAPEFLSTAGRDDVPFGVFFIHGRGFDGFHVRFRDIARGGVRIVRPQGHEQYILESERLYDEAYGLAHAQQLKNKDIPEGGSKGVILAQPDTAFDQVAKAYADALLDLIVAGPETLLADYYGAEESLYLGPDENISSALISWIVDRARRRGHPMPNVFMSSKPGAGINHKVYGVTSEGVTVFLEAALKQQGIDPRRQPFTVKITGGPDGDVAGNEILILHREYGDNARILGIADGSGCAEDPDGLDHGELLRLVQAELPISHFDRARLGSNGRLLLLHEAGGLQARNTLHNRLTTDAFIPAGGRPRTINEDNWRGFLRADGRPSSPLIVEGANLFITPSARLSLSAEGVVIIKDSSANKCGVICSSYEIIASMLLSEADFLEIKDTFVAQVLNKLRELAALEAQILFREHRQRPDLSFPELSVRLSRAIIRATDAVAQAADRLWSEQRELTEALIRGYLPPVLLERAGSDPFSRIPDAYLSRIIASVLSSRMVYREGLNWFSHLDTATIADLAIRYLQEEAEVERLAALVTQSQLPEKERIARLLSEGGVRVALQQAF